MSWSGAVLVGGASRRMGRDKASITVDGQPMAARVAAALDEAGAKSVICVGGVPVDGRRTVPDEHPGEGPLAALITALRASLRASPDESIVVLACDLVHPDPATIRAVAEQHSTDSDATVPVVDGQPQWLHAVWSASRCIGPLENAFTTGERSLHRAARCLDVRLVVMDGPGFADADRPEDLPGDR